MAASRRFDSFQISDFWSQSGASKTQKVLVLSTEKEGAKAAIRAQLLPGITDAMQSECFNSMFLQLLYHESHTKVSCFITNTYKTHAILYTIPTSDTTKTVLSAMYLSDLLGHANLVPPETLTD